MILRILAALGGRKFVSGILISILPVVAQAIGHPLSEDTYAKIIAVFGIFVGGDAANTLSHKIGEATVAKAALQSGANAAASPSAPRRPKPSGGNI